jgi:hypothetical protein
MAGISSVSGVSPGTIGISPLLFEPATSTPLEDHLPGGAVGPGGADGPGDDGADDAIPPPPLWAMRDRMHAHRPMAADEPGRVHRRLGDGDAALYVTDDGPDHCMISRQVGRSADGCVYCLVGRIPLYRYEELAQGEVAPAEAFADARDLCLCGVFEAERSASNVILVRHYRGVGSVPAEYLPPAPFLEFADPVDGG